MLGLALGELLGDALGLELGELLGDELGEELGLALAASWRGLGELARAGLGDELGLALGLGPGPPATSTMSSGGAIPSRVE